MLDKIREEPRKYRGYFLVGLIASVLAQDLLSDSPIFFSELAKNKLLKLIVLIIAT